MELLGNIRRWHNRDNVSIRKIAAKTSLSRITVRKYLPDKTITPDYLVRRPALTIDASGRSVLFEMDLISEGVPLPGKELMLVIADKLRFRRRKSLFWRRTSSTLKRQGWPPFRS